MSDLTLAKNNEKIMRMFTNAAHKKRSGTDPKDMIRKRKRIAGYCDIIETLSEKIQQEGISPEEQSKALNSINSISMVTMVSELEYLCDCLSVSYEIEIEKDGKPTGKIGEIRVTIAEILDEIADSLKLNRESDEPENGVLENQDIGLSMLRDLGEHFKCFKDKHGVHDPHKYDQPDEPAVPAKKASEDEVMSEEEGNEVSREAKEKFQK